MTLATGPIAFAAIGDAEDPATWSGTPSHFLDAARAEGLRVAGLRFDLAATRTRGRLLRWGLARLVRFGAPRGLQYDRGFLDALWATVPAPAPGTVLVNCSQVFPDAIVQEGQYPLVFYLDQTLTQLFDYYDHAAHVAPDLRADVIARETAQYAQARAIIFQSRWAADDVLTHYGIDPARVHVVLPGANLDPVALATWDSTHTTPRHARIGALRLGFVGKDWERKGLDRLIRAVALARDAGAAVDLDVIGPEAAMLPAALRDVPGIRWLGFVDKRRDPARFLALLDGFDVGCLLSRREAGGISLRECARLGIPTLAPDTGGAPEYAVPGATTLIAPEAPDAVIAEAIVALATDPAYFARQRAAAWAARHDADWRTAARRFRAVLETIA